MLQIKLMYMVGRQWGTIWVAADSVEQAKCIAGDKLRTRLDKPQGVAYEFVVLQVRLKSKLNNIWHG